MFTYMYSCIYSRWLEAVHAMMWNDLQSSVGLHCGEKSGFLWHFQITPTNRTRCIYNFYSASTLLAMQTAVISRAEQFCLSVRPSRSGVLSRRMKIRSCGFQHRVGQDAQLCGRLEWETIFYGQYRSILNHCDIIGLKMCRVWWKNAK